MQKEGRDRNVKAERVERRGERRQRTRDKYN
jgi:hypothetical protein